MIKVSFKKNKKRKFKKSFYFFLLLIIFTILFFFFKTKILHLVKILDFNKKALQSTETKVLEEKNILDLFILRLISQNLEYASSSEKSISGDQKIYLKNTKNDSGYIFINNFDNPEKVWITFASAISSDPLKTKLERDLKNLDYIDLRFDNKVFYKFKDSFVSIQASSTNFEASGTSQDH